MHRLLIRSATSHLREGAGRIERCLEHVDDGFVWTDPNDHLVSVGNLVQHLCGNVSQYILQGMGGEATARDRDAEFRSKTRLARGPLVARLTDVVERACAVLEALPPGALQRNYTIQGFEYDGVGALVHVVEHFSYHVGQITFAVKQARGLDIGYYAGQDLNRT